MKLYEYLSNNRDRLLPYQEQGIRIPDPPEGVLYKNMGVQENQNCTTITLRMKHRHLPLMDAMVTASRREFLHAVLD